jgi:ubiquinone/menaquinone biosynthesis C-methylase UbiE
MTPILVVEAAGIGAGDRVLDVACGDGDTTLHAARRVGPRGLALGVDVSAPMVERARRRAGEAGLANVGFLQADARTRRFAPLRFDVVVSQRGLMRWTPGDGGFANLARALRPGGRLVFVSLDDPGRVGAELTRAGLVPTGATRADVDGLPSWIFTAGAPLAAGAEGQDQLASSRRTPLSADGWRSRESARASI